jgi:hypothetical protein
MDDLTASQLNALQNLSRKKAGEEQHFVNIGAARALTELGLAERSREGWDITQAGVALLARLAPLAPPSADEPTPPTDINKGRGPAS